MAIIRSHRLFAGEAVSGTAVVVYTCPSGVRAILRAADFTLPGISLANTFYLGLVDAATTLQLWVMIMRVQPEAPYVQYRGTVVLYPGDQLFAESAETIMNYQGSGAILPV